MRLLLHVRRLETGVVSTCAQNRYVHRLTSNSFQSPDKLHEANSRKAASFEERDRMTTQTIFVRKNRTQDNAEDGAFPETTLAKMRFKNSGSYSSSRSSDLSSYS